MTLFTLFGVCFLIGVGWQIFGKYLPLAILVGCFYVIIIYLILKPLIG